MKAVILLAALLSGCAFTLTDINTGVNIGRTFDDGAVLSQGRTAWGASISGHYTRRSP